MPDRDAARGNAAYRIACALVLLGWVALFAHVLVHPVAFQWDFKSYYVASHVYELGGNPYDVKTLRDVAGGARILPFYYPLSGLHALRPICSLNYPIAYRLWLILKALALAALFLVWKRWFLQRTDWLWILALGLLGFGAAAMWDIKAGNVSIFEQLFLWTGFAFLLRSRAGAFVICVVLASVFKMVLAALLLLLLLPSVRSRANLLKMAAGMAAVAVMVLLPFSGKPELFDAFVHGLRTARPSLEYNPTFFSALDELGVKYKVGLFAGPLKYVVLVAYYAVLGVTGRRLIRSAYASASIRFPILVAVMLYMLLIPRSITYSYIVVFVPVLALVFPVLARSKLAGYAALVALSVGGIPAIPASMGTFIGHWTPFLLLLGCWIALVVVERSGALAQAIAER